MNKEILLSQLNFNSQIEEEKFTFHEKEIVVKKHISILDKMVLIDHILQDSLMESGSYNVVAVSAYSMLYTAIFYSNLILDIDGTEKVFDKLEELICSGLCKEIMNRIPKSELDLLNSLLKDEQIKREQFAMSIGGAIKFLINNLPQRADEMKEILNNFDPNKFQEVVEFAKMANGNRPIK